LRQQAESSVAQALQAGGNSSPGQAQMHILAALTKLRRAACDPRLVAPELGMVGAKVQEFERLAQELVAGRHKALVFSQFTDFLRLLRERLDAAGLKHQYLDGSTPQAQRTQRVAAFQAGEGDFFLISLKAGGFGLNLTMADYVIIADPWWNPAAEDQASGRAHRIGQQRPVTVYRLVTQGSIEDRIVQLHSAKRALAEGVLTAQDGDDAAGSSAVMDAAQMLALLRGDTD
jgi:SNF2 family DNA or RNA helicase